MPIGARGAAEFVHHPLVDNAAEPFDGKSPHIIGIDGPSLEVVIGEMVDRVKAGKNTVALCAWGYNRSGLIAGLTMRDLGYSFEDTIRLMRAARGPHPMGWGEALNNPHFRALVERA